MTIDDVLRRALEAEADEVSVPDDAWERLVERLAREPAAAVSPPTPPRHWVLLSAALVLIVTAVAAAVTLSHDDNPVRTGSEEGDPSQTASTVTSPPTTVEAVRPAAEPPSKAVMVSKDGELLRIDLATGQTETLATSPESTDPETGIVYDHVEQASIGGDGAVLFSTCCEPAGGETFIVRPDGRRRQVAFGYNPTFGPGGDAYAVVDPVFVRITSLSDDTDDRLIEAGAHVGGLAAIAWSPGGGMLALESVMPGEHGSAGGEPRSEVLLVPVTARTLDQAQVLASPAGHWWSDPVFRSDGSLLVIEHDEGTGTTALRAVGTDGRAGDLVDIQGMEPGLLAADRTGGWVLIAGASGGPGLILDPTNEVAGEPTLSGEPLVDVAW